VLGRVATVSRLRVENAKDRLLIIDDDGVQPYSARPMVVVGLDDVDDLIKSFDEARGLPTFTVPPEQTAVQIVGWLMSLMEQSDDVAAAQIQAIADGILEGHWLNDAIAKETPRETTRSSGVGPVHVNIDMARGHGWSERQISRCLAVCHASSRLEGRLVNHAKGYTRQCPVCECWTRPEGECHLCEQDKKHDRRAAKAALQRGVAAPLSTAMVNICVQCKRTFGGTGFCPHDGAVVVRTASPEDFE